MINNDINQNNPKSEIIDAPTDDKKKLIENEQNNTTIVIKNINKNLTNEKIYTILRDHFFPKERTFNAIYTERKSGRYKNSGICFINFFQPNHIQYFLEKFADNNYFFNQKEHCQLFWSKLQGDDFIKEMVKKNQDRSINFLIFSNSNNY